MAKVSHGPVADSASVQRSFYEIDVFTTTPYFGNALAVVLDGAGLTGSEMQRFARWTNLSETTFVLPPPSAGADYQVRIFTPAVELPFAGHPTRGRPSPRPPWSSRRPALAGTPRCGSSRRPWNCRSRAIRRWAPAMPGCRPGEGPPTLRSSCRGAARA